MKILITLIALCAWASAGVAEQPHPTYTAALPNETAWAWMARNHLAAPPLNHSMELEPDETLITSTPYVMPKWNDPLFNAFAEQEIIDKRPDGKHVVRVYRRGVFFGYKLIWRDEDAVALLKV